MIGLILSYRGTNYGMMLQAFATQAYLDSKKVKTEIISVKEERSIGDEIRNLVRHASPTALKASMRKKKRRKLVVADPMLSNAHRQRVEVGKTFVTKYLHDIVQYYSIQSASRTAENKYTCVMIGSDQQWAPACFYSKINTLSFVPSNVARVSYATSMGVSKIPRYTRARLKSFVEKMDFVSVREETGKNIITSVVDRDDINVVPDPTFLLTSEEWKNCIHDEVIETSPYIFCYFLGDDISPIQYVNCYAKNKNLKVIAVRNIESYSKEQVDYGDAEIVDAPTVEQFVNYIRHAELVCTDSFHGTVFSIINNRDFISFYRTNSRDKNSRNSRIDDLLETLGVEDRIIKCGKTIESIAENKINYNDVNVRVSSLRKVGIDYLEKIIKKDSEKKVYNYNVSELKKEDCCGCGVCQSRCPKKIIDLVCDEERFYYPTVKANDCIHCGLCVASCPIKNRDQANASNFKESFYAYNQNIDLCKKSASGGIAAGLYRVFLKRDGFVCGVRYSADFKNVIYDISNRADDVDTYLGSKYIKANPYPIFSVIKEKLDDCKEVFFVGLPCEVAALKLYIKKEYSNLFTCELICHGPTSPLILNEYITSLEKKNSGKVLFFTCRGKLPLWKPYYIYATFDNGKEFKEKFTGSSFEKAFQIFKRPSCNECSFKDGSSCSDLIIGDFHGAKQDSKEFNQFGTSICFANTEKGLKLIEWLNTENFTIGRADYKRAIGNKALFSPIPRMPSRNIFFDMLKNKGLDYACNSLVIRAELKKKNIGKKLVLAKKKILKH